MAGDLADFPYNEANPPPRGEYCSAHGGEQSAKSNVHWLTAAELQRKVFPPLRVLVDPVIAEGVTLFAGREKIGKSWLMLDLATAVCRGNQAAGTWNTERHDALYLALEDGEKRLQRRMQKLFGDEEWPGNFYMKTDAPRLGDGLAEFLEGWTNTADNAGLCIIDTLQHIRPMRKDQRYQDDTQDLRALKEIADRLDIAIVLVHHLRKAAAEGDAFDLISGSTGLAAGADATVVLQRHPSGQGFELYTRGRDIAEREMAMTFEAEACRWSATNRPAEQVFQTDERSKLLEVVREMGEATIQSVTEELGEDYDAVRKRLDRAHKAGALMKIGRGRYALPPSGSSGPSGLEDE